MVGLARVGFRTVAHQLTITMSRSLSSINTLKLSNLSINNNNQTQVSAFQATALMGPLLYREMAFKTINMGLSGKCINIHLGNIFEGLSLITYANLHAILTLSPLVACNTQWKCIGGLTLPLPLVAYVINGRPLWCVRN